MATCPASTRTKPARNGATSRCICGAASYDVPPPGGESLKDTVARVLPYYNQEILPAVLRGERTIVAAHGNSLRALVMVLDRLTPKTIPSMELATGVPLVYRLKAEFDGGVEAGFGGAEGGLICLDLSPIVAGDGLATDTGDGPHHGGFDCHVRRKVRLIRPGGDSNVDVPGKILSTPWNIFRAGPPKTSTSPEFEHQRLRRAAALFAAKAKAAGVAERKGEDRRGKVFFVAVLMRAHAAPARRRN